MKREAYFILYGDDDGRDVKSEEFADPITAYHEAKHLQGIVYKRTEEPFDIQGLCESLKAQKAEIEKSLMRLAE